MMTTHTVIFRGGLGNQLFQYCNAVRMQEAGHVVKFNKLWGFARDFRYERKYELSAISGIKYSLSPFYLVYLCYYKLFPSFKALRILRRKYNIGYHQNVQRAIETISKYPNRFTILSAEGCPPINHAAFHFRAFVQPFCSAENIPISYIKKIEQVLKVKNIGKLDVFTSDKEAFLEIVQDYTLFSEIQISVLGTQKPLDDMKSLSCYRYIFLSNSTFSLWSAFIARFIDGRDCTIYLPDPRGTAWRMPCVSACPNDWVVL